MALKRGKIRLKNSGVHYTQPRGEASRKSLDEVGVDYKPPKKVQGVKSEHVPPRKIWTEQNRQMQTEYGRFLLKYDDLENTIDKFSTKDICFYFREVANENGVKYHLVFAKDCAVVKHLRETYSVREICGMIEFLFTSDQDYLPKNRISIGVLGSRWVNTIYPDFELWLNDEYKPGKHYDNGNMKYWKEREWDKGEKETKVGEW